MVKIVIVSFVLCYYLFTSGMVFELTKAEMRQGHDTPYSIALSNERVRIVGVSNNDDINCVKWVVENTPSGIQVYIDYTGTSLLIGIGVWKFVTSQPEGQHYILLNTWNVENDKMVWGWFEGLREYTPLPDLNNATEVYRSGKAVVYKVD